MTGRSAHNRVDLIGKTFGSWEVLRYVETRRKQPFWDCLCTKCGKVYVVGSNSLRNGSKGCFSCKTQPKGREKIRTPEEEVLHQVFASYKIGARNRNLSFKLERDLFVKLTQSPCFYCGGGFASYGTTAEKVVYYNGVDRVDNSKGYLVNNVVPCCKPCNNKKFAVTKEMIHILYNVLFEGPVLQEDEMIYDPDIHNAVDFSPFDDAL